MKPKIGQWVDYPADGSLPAGRGEIDHISEGEHMGRKFWWVSVRKMKRNGVRIATVWPTTRLGFPDRE